MTLDRSADGLRFRRLAPFVSWLILFYSTWLSIVWLGSYWSVVREHWAISLAMLLGSYVAGSTPMGGGTVGFPILVLLFDLPGSLGRNFGLAIQSIGMVSASIYIFCTGRPLEWTLLRSALVGSCIGTPLGAVFIAPNVSDLWVKMLFAVVWASFGLMHLAKLNEFVGYSGISHGWQKLDRPIGIAIGLLGGVVSSITGVGIDMIIYAVLVLLYRADLKIAIPTSVVLMAFTSLIGIFTNLFLSWQFPDRFHVSIEVFYSWLAAAPVVALGAPLGAVVVNLISRTPTLIFVSLLCLAQFVWTAIHERLSLASLLFSLLGIAAMNLCFYGLYRCGLYRWENSRP